MALLASAREKIATGTKVTTCDPGGNRLAHCLRDLELHWPVRLALHDDRAAGDYIALVCVAYPEQDEVSVAQLAVDGQIEQGQVTGLVPKLQADAK